MINDKHGRITEFKFSFLMPKFWLIWLIFAFAFFLSKISFKIRNKICQKIGILLFHFARKRKQITIKNIQIAMPNLAQSDIEASAKEHFKSYGQGFSEAIELWLVPHQNQCPPEMKKHFHYHGLENLKNFEQKQGILLVSPHCTHGEMSALGLSFVCDFKAIYRPQNNPLLEYLITNGRLISPTQDLNKRSFQLYDKKNVRSIVKGLQNNEIISIQPDQKFKGKNSLNIPFFGKNAPTNPGICKLAKMGNAIVVPFFTHRIGEDYHIFFKPHLSNFPSGDEALDIMRLNNLYEQEIIQHPEQYLWMHNRWDLKI